MKKKKLLIVAGAGASLDFGLPSVGTVDKLLDQHATQSHPLATDPANNLYRYCRDAIASYYAQSPRPALQKSVNFEEVLYQLNLLIPYRSDSNFSHGSNALLKARDLPDLSRYGNPNVPVDGNVLRTFTATLMDALADYFVDTCEFVSHSKKDEVAALRGFLDALKTEFDIGIITLNYDNVFTQALPGLHTGFDPATGAFKSGSVLDRSEWEFIYHLHGSIHFAMTGTGGDLHRITWRASPAKDQALHAFGRNSMNSMEGTTYPISPVVAGYGKPQQLQRQPFRTYFAQCTRLAHEADSLLFLGYGFADYHLNAAFSEIRDRHRPIVVVDWARDNEDPLPARHDQWSRHLCQTLFTNPNSMGPPGYKIPAFIGDLKANNDLEVSHDATTPLAVWYNGMLAACRNPGKILQRLV